MTDRPLRVALGLHSLQLGGSQINTVDLGVELRDRGHDVTLWAIDAKRYEATIDAHAAAAGFEIELLAAEHTVRAQARHVRDLVDRLDADVLHVHHENHWLGPVAAVATRSRPGCASVVTNWMMEHTHYLPRHASLIVGFPRLRDEAASHRPGPVFVLEPPVNTDRDRVDDADSLVFRRGHGIDDDELLAVIVSRVDHDMKLVAIEHAITATTVADLARLRLVIVGDGEAMPEVERAVRDANDALGREAVLTVGAMSDPRPAYGAADIVFGMGGSALRGLAFGKPLIVQGDGTYTETFDPDSAAAFFEHGFHGAATDDPTAEAFARRIRALVDPAVRERLGTFGRTVIDERYSLDVLAGRLEQIYRTSCDRPLHRWQRWSDAAYVLAYEWIGRTVPPERRQAIRARIPALRSGKRTWT